MGGVSDGVGIDEGTNGMREYERRNSVKDLELPTFTLSPKVSVSARIDYVNLALKEAAESRCRRRLNKSF